ncbi:ABC transporter ATP-binding protein [Candidatus Halobonum tyrrellensis]|uniref:ABC-type D-xylose/L-arabinose transporter n=1 Tax=Candidatus Halobonum tyrrellensis G22 TaxID=1324957 RepID=V4IW26_9EURY|nr:ABC transporter ATP-binding protein [Candidatus Halobonum tyrrellensis]ESP87367.1 sugar ABC transporter ATP-binding protein [Candidatus Halobonum tyrrellensis G22]
MVETELDDLRKEYGDVVAADDVTLTLHDGEFLVLLGPSGCGKSTTLRMLAGLEPPTSGAVLVDGEDVTDQGPNRRDFAMVFQQVALYPHMSVRDNISSPLRAAGVDPGERDDRVERTAAMLDIADLLDRTPGELSGGQQQRVAIGRALVREPRAFLLDEPFSKLDQKLRIQLQKELKRLQDQTGVTTVFVTHDQEEAMVLADRIAVMDDGKLQQVDTPETLYRFPTNEFVADFIGNPTMNFFDVSVTGREVVVDGARYEFPAGTADADADLSTVRRLAARPEDIVPVSADDDGDGRLHATVELVEMRGSTTYLVVDHAGEELTILQPPGERFVEGDEVALTLRLDRVSLFDERGELVRHVDADPVAANAERR